MDAKRTATLGGASPTGAVPRLDHGHLWQPRDAGDGPVHAFIDWGALGIGAIEQKTRVWSRQLGLGRVTHRDDRDLKILQLSQRIGVLALIELGAGACVYLPAVNSAFISTPE